MITQETIDRINFLAHKSKSPEGLTPEEKAEQQKLRREYIEAFRANTLRALENVSVLEPDGSVHPLIKK